MQANHSTTLRAHQVVHGNAQGVTDPSTLPHDLIRSQFFVRIRTADARHSLHFRHSPEPFHADGCCLQAQITVQTLHKGIEIIFFVIAKAIHGGHGHSPNTVQLPVWLNSD